MLPLLRGRRSDDHALLIAAERRSKQELRPYERIFADISGELSKRRASRMIGKGQPRASAARSKPRRSRPKLRDARKATRSDPATLPAA